MKRGCSGRTMSHVKETGLPAGECPKSCVSKGRGFTLHQEEDL